jgi:hypothetical protein
MLFLIAVADSVDDGADLYIVTTLKDRSHPIDPHSGSGLLAGHECPAYSSERSRFVVCR